jgi:hypothetical protein
MVKGNSHIFQENILKKVNEFFENIYNYTKGIFTMLI